MMPEIKINNSDLLIMNLVHYFITEKNYNPVILHGITDEIWLENLDEDYKIIRIVSHYIHNNEQLSFDKFKLRKIIGNLKKKTFCIKMPTVSIYTNLGDGVELKKDEDGDLNVTIKTGKGKYKLFYAHLSNDVTYTCIQTKAKKENPYAYDIQFFPAKEVIENGVIDIKSSE